MSKYIPRLSKDEIFERFLIKKQNDRDTKNKILALKKRAEYEQLCRQREIYRNTGVAHLTEMQKIEGKIKECYQSLIALGVRL